MLDIVLCDISYRPRIQQRKRTPKLFPDSWSVEIV